MAKCQVLAIVLIINLEGLKFLIGFYIFKYCRISLYKIHSWEFNSNKGERLCGILKGDVSYKEVYLKKGISLRGLSPGS